MEITYIFTGSTINWYTNYMKDRITKTHWSKIKGVACKEGLLSRYDPEIGDLTSAGVVIKKYKMKWRDTDGVDYSEHCIIAGDTLQMYFCDKNDFGRWKSESDRKLVLPFYGVAELTRLLLLRVGNVKIHSKKNLYHWTDEVQEDLWRVMTYSSYSNTALKTYKGSSLVDLLWKAVVEAYGGQVYERTPRTDARIVSDVCEG